MSVPRITMSADGPEFSRLAQGFGSAARWNKDARQVLEHVIACVDLGITTMDNAAIYGGGLSETLLGKALALAPGLRERLEIVTKCAIGQWDTSLYHYDTSRAHILWSVDESLRRLHTDRVDLLLIHRPDPLMDADEVAEAFVALRDTGKVLHFGVSNFTRSQFDLLSSRLPFPLVTNEIQFSVLHLDTWHDGTLDLCQERRISPMAWGPLGGGRLLSDKDERVTRVRAELEAVGAELGGAAVDQVALAWLLRHPSRIVPILGTGKIERVQSATGAFDLTLTREHYFRIWTASTGERLP